MKTWKNLCWQETWFGGSAAGRKGLRCVLALNAAMALAFAADPQPGTFSFYFPTSSASESAGAVVFTVVRNGGNDGTVSVDVTTSDGTALAGSDYVGTNATLVFSNGQNVRTFALTLLDDALMEPCETMQLSLTNPTGGAMLEAPDTVTLTLRDDDTPGTAWDDASLRQAIAAGGVVRFVCDDTIYLSGAISISNNVTLDGTGHDVTLAGGFGMRLFDVTGGARLELVHLTLKGGLAQGASSPGYPAPGFSADGGAVRLRGGELAAVDCRFTDNLAQGGGGVPQFVTHNIVYASGGGSGAGGAISGSNATVCLTNCLFARNVALGGDGANGLSSGFFYRAAGGASQGGAIAMNGGTLRLSQCSFATNTTPENSDLGAFRYTGGAIYATGCRIEAWDTSFLGNSSSFGYGGACWTENGTLQTSNCVWLGNSCHWSGGAIYNQSGVQTHRAAVFRQNQAFLGGAIHHATQSVTLADCYFASNVVYDAPGGFSLPTVSVQGGALNLASGTGEVVRSTFWRNVAQNPNGAHGFGGAICNAGQLSLANCTLAENAARSLRQDANTGRGSVGGAIASLAGTVAVRSCTIATNEIREPNAGPFGGAGALGGGCYNAGGNFTLVSCILAGNLVNTNEPVNASGVIVDLGHNLSSDATPVFSANGSQNNINPRLGLLAFYGGLTPTLPLLSGSPALDAADASQCPPTDQRGLPRPFGTGCDIGAVEQQPLHRITSIQRLDGDVRLRGTGLPNLSFTVQATTDFDLWIAAGSGMIGADGAFDLSLAANDAAQRFFRLVTP